MANCQNFLAISHEFKEILEKSSSPKAIGGRTKKILKKRVTLRIFCFTFRAAARWKVQNVSRKCFCSAAPIINRKSQNFTVRVFWGSPNVSKSPFPGTRWPKITVCVCSSPEIHVFVGRRWFWACGKALPAALWKHQMILWTRKTGPWYPNSNDLHAFRQQTMLSPGFPSSFESLEIRWKPLKVVRAPVASLSPTF